MALGKGLGSLIPAKKAVEVSITTEEVSNDGVFLVAVELIMPNPDQPRRTFEEDALSQLVESIKVHGIIQPLTVSPREDKKYELVAGERRYRAAQRAGLTKVPVVVKDGSEQEKFEWALIENIQRQDLNPVEEASAFQRLADEFGLTQQEIAQRVGKSRSAVANAMRLLSLPEEIHEALVNGKIGSGKARALLSITDKDEQMKVFQEMIGTSASVRDVEQRVSQVEPHKRRGAVRRDPNLVAHEQNLEEALSTKVRITQKGDKGTIVLHYYSLEELKNLLGRLSESN